MHDLPWTCGKGIPNVRSPEGWVFITPPLIDVFSVLGKQVAMLGRPRSTIQVDDRFIRLKALINRFITGNQILKNRTQNARNVAICSKTGRRRLNESGLSAKYSAKS
ncbi:hypothetical protein YQE_09497, partial [Dendroctonus ponderosae]